MRIWGTRLKSIKYPFSIKFFCGIENTLLLYSFFNETLSKIVKNFIIYSSQICFITYSLYVFDIPLTKWCLVPTMFLMSSGSQMVLCFVLGLSGVTEKLFKQLQMWTRIFWQLRYVFFGSKYFQEGSHLCNVGLFSFSPNQFLFISHWSESGKVG